jgi:predicted TIM-barrel fold metal-dependent hydrolase
MREAGYLVAVYKNVYLDFGEVFPFVSRLGQKRIVEQILELCPTTKALWSSEFESFLLSGDPS